MSQSAAPRFTITIDRDPSVKDAIARAMGVESRWFQSCEDYERALPAEPMAVFVDVALSVGDERTGQIIPRLKDSWPLAPVFLTSPEHDSDALTEGMALGADDFVAKPIEPVDLNKRVTVRLRALAKRAARETILFGDMSIDTMQRSVTSTRGQRFLSPTEIKLLSELAKASGNVVPRDMLKQRCWPQMTVSDNALNRKLYEIRRRLKPISDSVNIRTIYGVGFVMEQK
jgi:DNA-binding response OmpR family regulator